MEEGRKPGGVGEAINQLVAEENIECDVFVSAIEDGFIPAGDKETLSKQSGIDVDSIIEGAKLHWGLEWESKHFWFLGKGKDQVFMIKTARSMGVLTVAVDANEAAPGLKLADYAEAIDFTKVDQVISYCHGLIDQGVSLCGVSTMGSDIPHLLAKIAAHFEWNGPSLQTGEWASHKFKMKQRFSEKGIPVPVYAQVNDAKEVYEVWQTWDCSKVIIKPTDRAGSRGVQLIVDESDIESAFAYAETLCLKRPSYDRGVC